jgi:hypothetical protein
MGKFEGCSHKTADARNFSLTSFLTFIGAEHQKATGHHNIRRNSSTPLLPDLMVECMVVDTVPDKAGVASKNVANFLGI